MIRFDDASPNLSQHLSNPPALDVAVEQVVEADLLLGRSGFNLARTQIVQIPPPEAGGPIFYCIFPKGRGKRPVNTGDDEAEEDPLSPDAVRRSGQSYYVIRCGLRLLLLANPYGYAPRCATWAAADDIEQSAAGGGNMPWERLLECLLALCAALGGDIVGFNALAGNSMRRLHFVSHRPPHGIAPYALQQAAAGANGGEEHPIAHIGRAGEYPLDTWRFGFSSQAETASAAAALLGRWRAAGGPFATATIAAALEAGAPVLYVTPRNRLLAPFGWPGMAAVMEVMGAGVTSRARMIGRVRAGDWGYANFRRLLASLRPRGVESLY